MQNRQGGTHVRKRPRTSILAANMWFFTRMRSTMYDQRRPLDKALAAAGECAAVRPLIHVDAVVPRQVGLAVEGLWARQ